MIDPGQFKPTERRLVASFPASLATSLRADRNANDRRARELVGDWLAMRRDCIGAGSGLVGGFARRVVVSAERFDATKIAGCVLDVDPSEPSLRTNVQASISGGSDFSIASWAKSQCSVIANDAVAPDATTTADRVTVIGAATLPTISQTITSSGSAAAKVPNNIKFYVKRNDIDWIYFEGQTGLNKTWFNISTGTVGTISVSHGSVSITDAGSGWWLVALSVNAASTTQTFKIGLCTSDNATTAPAAGAYVWLWGATVDEQRIAALVNRASGVTWSEASASFQPGVGTINARGAIRGYGGAHRITSTEAAVVAAFVDAAPFTVVAAVASNDPDSARAFLGSGNNTVANTHSRAFGTNTTSLGRWRYSTVSSTGAGVNSEHIPDVVAGIGAVYELYSPGITLSMQINGDTPIPNGGAHNPLLSTPTQVSLMSRPDSAPDSFWLGTVGRLAFFIRELSAAERSYLRVGIGNQYAIAVAA